MNMHLEKRPIWLTRHGQSVYNVESRIGGGMRRGVTNERHHNVHWLMSVGGCEGPFSISNAGAEKRWSISALGAMSDMSQS